MIHFYILSTYIDDNDIAISATSKTKRDRLLRKRKEMQSKVAKYLTEEALRRGSSDNITTIIIWLTQDIEY